MTIPLDPKKAALALGRPHQAFESVSPYPAPDVLWLRIGSGPDLFGGPFIIRDAEPIVVKGYSTASAWLRRAVMPLAVAPDAGAVAQVLEGYEALPIGWHASSTEVEDPSTRVRGGLHVQPFELALVTLGYVHPKSRLLGAPMGPPEPMFPPGGYSPPLACRAVLKEIGSRLTWIVEQHDGAGGWQRLLGERIE